MKFDNLSFEECMSELEKIVQTMEKGEAKLDDSLRLFQDGTELVTRCNKLLDDAVLKVRIVTAGADGKPVEEAFTDAP